MPHSCPDIPPSLEHNLNLRDISTGNMLEGACDICVPFVTGAPDYTSAALIESLVAPGIINVNRIRKGDYHVDKHAVEGGNEQLNAHGMIFRASWERNPSKIQTVLSRPYTRAEFNKLADLVYEPYCADIKEAMMLAKEKHGIAIHVDLHSMPGSTPHTVQEGLFTGAYYFGNPAPYGENIQNGELPDIVLIDKKEACSREIAHIVEQTFRDQGLMVVTMDVGSSGGRINSEQWYDPTSNMHSIGIEIVGRDFEPARDSGHLFYNRVPKKEAQFKRAYQTLFARLEKIAA